MFQVLRVLIHLVVVMLVVVLEVMVLSGSSGDDVLSGLTHR